MINKQESLPHLESRVWLKKIVQGKREFLGFAELTIGGAFVIRDICILRVRDEDGESSDPFVSFPAKRGTGTGEGKYFDIAHPVTSQARQKASAVILEAYRKAAMV